MLEWDSDLKIRGTSLYLDGKIGRGLSFVSHAHSDHIAGHGRMIATAATAAFSEHRLGLAESLATEGADSPAGGEVLALGYEAVHEMDRETRLELMPAGHVLGSAMVRVTREEGSLLYTGDFTLQSSLTAEAARPGKADYLVMETTYGLEHFRFPPRGEVTAQLLELVEGAFREGRQPIVMGYSLGKAQEITKVLTDAKYPVTLHGAPYNLSKIYERQAGEGSLGRYGRYVYSDFHGADAVDLRCRGVLVAPPQVARSAFVTRFKNPVTIMMTGWGLLKNAKYRYGVDHVLPMSDHADFGGLVELVERVGPREVFTHHGYAKEFADYLRGKGIAARVAVPERQMVLFE